MGCFLYKNQVLDVFLQTDELDILPNTVSQIDSAKHSLELM
jgi:hypothetical protein